ncbi:MAG: cupredoxin domain-containing protein [Acidobacteria bacterium]|nr:cupredoxin domain-containing protein [Acidobacteriota bacterium]
MKRLIILTLLMGLVFGIPAHQTAFGVGSTKGKVIRLTAKKFAYSPAEITVKKGEPVVLELTSKDSKHGFNLPDFGVRADVKSGSVSRVSFTPDKVGRFTFACDIYCGSGHEDMSGTLVVTE